MKFSDDQMENLNQLRSSKPEEELYQMSSCLGYGRMV
jgi:hypothetical protein